MTATAASTYVNRYGVLPGKKIIIAANNDSAYGPAMTLARAGAEVTMLDARQSLPDNVTGLLETRNVALKTGNTALNAYGKKCITSLDLAVKSGNNWAAGETLDCDLLLLSGGWSPVVSLLSHRSVRPVWDKENLCFVAPVHDEPIQMAGSANAVWGTSDCEASGRTAAESAIAAINGNNTSVTVTPPGGWDTPIEPLYEVKVEGKKLKCFIDPQHDVTADDVRLAHQEGFVSVEHLKRYTTLGMATDQGKIGNIIGLALMAEALGREIQEVGTTTFRPPYTPISLGAQRPWYFAREGEGITEAYIRETITTRETVGLVDVTSLGKIAIQGPDATEFINRIYSNAFAKLPIGKARYGIMLRDDGIVMMTTTTAHAAKVMVWLEELLQTRWSNLKVHVTSVSEQWAGSAVAGPKSREVLQACVEDATAVSNDALPFMGVIETRLKNGIACRIARISFSGEMAYEMYVGSDYAESMMDLLWESAKTFDGCLYGTEALGALRIEKGHVTGVELDGRVTIEDAGLGAMASLTGRSWLAYYRKIALKLLKQVRCYACKIKLRVTGKGGLPR